MMIIIILASLFQGYNQADRYIATQGKPGTTALWITQCFCVEYYYGKQNAKNMFN